jgi:hypothetical protein
LSALQRDAAARIVDRREHVVVLPRAEEDAVANTNHGAILESPGHPREAETRSEVVPIGVVPRRARRTEPTARNAPHFVATVLLDDDRVVLVTQPGVERQVRPPFHVVLDVAEIPPPLSLDEREVDDAEAFEAVDLEIRTALVREARRVAFADADEDAPDLAADFEIVAAADDGEVVQQAERLAVFDDCMRCRGTDSCRFSRSAAPVRPRRILIRRSTFPS